MHLRLAASAFLIFGCATGAEDAAPPKSVEAASGAIADTKSDSTQFERMLASLESDTTGLYTIMGSDAWFEKYVLLDVTGDGLLDTLRLRAVGQRAESLHIRLSAAIDGEAIPLATWRGADELGDPLPEVSTPGTARDRYVRARLNRVLTDASLSAFSDSTLSRAWFPREEWLDCDQDVHDCIVSEFRSLANPTVSGRALRALPFDTARAEAVVADIRNNARVALTIGYAYESGERVVWSPLAKRFFTVWACC